MRPEQERASLRLVLALAREACRRIPNEVAPFIDRLRIEIERHDAAQGRATVAKAGESLSPCLENHEEVSSARDSNAPENDPIELRRLRSRMVFP